MKYYVTRYDNSYSNIAVKDEQFIEEVLEARKLGEIIDAEMDFRYRPIFPSEWLLRYFHDDFIPNAAPWNAKMETLHSLIWLGGISCKMNQGGGSNLLGDDGVIHEAMHYLMTEMAYADYLVLYKMIRDFESTIPGVYPVELIIV